MAFLTGWTKRAPITVPAAQVGSGGVVNFPMLVPIVLPDDVIAALSYTDGRDIRFTNDAADTVYSHELVSIDTVAKTLQVWVKVPSLLSSAPTTFYLNCGNPAAAMPSAAEQQATWSGYGGMWHCEDVGPTSVVDATANVNTGTQSGGVIFGTPGKIGKALSFGGTDDYVNLQNAASLKPTSITVGAWVQTTANNVMIIATDDGDSTHPYSYDIWISNAANAKARIEIDGVSLAEASLLGATTVNDGQWHYIVGTYDGAYIRLYVDGVADASPLAYAGGAIDYTASDNVVLGKRTTYHFYTGLIDNPYVLADAHGAAWITTEYNNQFAPGTFASFGAVESAGGIITPRRFNDGLWLPGRNPGVM